MQLSWCWAAWFLFSPACFRPVFAHLSPIPCLASFPVWFSSPSTQFWQPLAEGLNLILICCHGNCSSFCFLVWWWWWGKGGGNPSLWWGTGVRVPLGPSSKGWVPAPPEAILRETSPVLLRPKGTRKEDPSPYPKESPFSGGFPINTWSRWKRPHG